MSLSPHIQAELAKLTQQLSHMQQRMAELAAENARLRQVETAYQEAQETQATLVQTPVAAAAAHTSEVLPAPASVLDIVRLTEFTDKAALQAWLDAMIAELEACIQNLST